MSLSGWIFIAIIYINDIINIIHVYQHLIKRGHGFEWEHGDYKGEVGRKKVKGKMIQL